VLVEGFLVVVAEHVAGDGFEDVIEDVVKDVVRGVRKGAVEDVLLKLCY